ncbi:ABC transporter ATP-binding protein [Syntrophomonas wolfei]|uniref:ABC transporter ATP-binding protein n=1 Tax=Syntrophomonas wolfei TaxID=863 RepID=A0A354YYR6_9FIRM|nr:ABC transporter ATP-binding protein [Syntrophomonas wolfei]HBK54490.1 ABC transporter ATP-binding protein [Syntrophomonas wolfei]
MKISVEQGSFGYPGSRTLFENLCFEVERGEILAILGPNGVGKTTLLKCMTCMLPWNRGAAYLDGQNIKYFDSVDIWRHLAYVPQVHASVFSYSVLDMVLMGRSAHINWFSMPGKNDRRVARNALESVGIGHLARRICSELSGGERQLVMIARALAAEPEIIILDEPESHLDFRNQLMILDILESISQQREISCIINTHYPEHALRISDKTLILGKECDYVVGETEEVISEDNLQKFFAVRTRLLSYTDRGVARKTVVAVAI